MEDVFVKYIINEGWFDSGIFKIIVLVIFGIISEFYWGLLRFECCFCNCCYVMRCLDMVCYRYWIK